MERPDPLVPEEVDLTDFKFMPLEVSRLLRSEFWMDAMDNDPRIAAASINLWAESWHQRPTASLPNNDRALARMAMIDRSVWHEIREAVMAPWVLCSDGRWYHPVVAEKAIDAWAEKVGYRSRKAQRIEAGRKGGLKRAENQGQAPLEVSLEAPLEVSLEAPLQAKGTGRGRGKGTGIKERDKSLSSDAAASGDPDFSDLPVNRQPSAGYTDEFESWWAAYPRKDSKGTAFKAFKAAKGRASVDRLMEGAAAYAKRRAGEDPQYTKLPASWLNADCWNDEQVQPKKKLPFPGYVPMGVGG
ncbi:Protein of unknown function DUF1376 [uncultured Caudovirales phage]|uniref:DUF1376 domain-containing protein n=1 Tax=uncultured Caudovirales phage TaxID=2100421 RepID=A0A6J7WQ85_9CAUD|nr:Protein of unknown function DUF1376 [uncultured Caudovirales phage]